MSFEVSKLVLCISFLEVSFCVKQKKWFLLTLFLIFLRFWIILRLMLGCNVSWGLWFSNYFCERRNLQKCSCNCMIRYFLNRETFTLYHHETMKIIVIPKWYNKWRFFCPFVVRIIARYEFTCYHRLNIAFCSFLLHWLHGFSSLNLFCNIVRSKLLQMTCFLSSEYYI